MKAYHIIGLGLFLLVLSISFYAQDKDSSANPGSGLATVSAENQIQAPANPSSMQSENIALDKAIYLENKVITIHVDDDDRTKCEVDYPIIQMRYGRHGRRHTITWYAADADYTVVFNNNASPIGTRDAAVIASREATAAAKSGAAANEKSKAVAANTITVPRGGSAVNGPFELLRAPTLKKSYATYEIWRGPAGEYKGECTSGAPHMPCLCPLDDKDTGVVVKP